MINITTTEAKLFAIRCGIITDFIHAAKKSFDSSSHPFQIYTASISYTLRKFFETNINNIIEFWECPSQSNWVLYKAIDEETKKFHPIPSFPWKISQDFSKKNECNSLINQWKITFQVFDDKGHLFLELVDDENNFLKPSYAKDGMWLRYSAIQTCYVQEH